jgi:uncharacterized membrane protein
MSSTRLEAFSDGVFAIAITLLILEIAVPVGAENDLLGALLRLWPAYLAYFVSFLTVGMVWVEHTAITDYLDRADSVLLRLNLLLLLVVAFLPFPTKLMAEYVGESEPERVAVVFYGLTLLAISVAEVLLWRYALEQRHLIRADADEEELAALTVKLAPSLGFYAVAIAISLALPSVGVFLYLAIAIYLVIPARTLHRQVRRFR